MDDQVLVHLELAASVLEDFRGELLADAERNPSEAARLHALVSDLGGLMPLSAVMARLLQRLDALRVR